MHKNSKAAVRKDSNYACFGVFWKSYPPSLSSSLKNQEMRLLLKIVSVPNSNIAAASYWRQYGVMLLASD